MRIMHLTTVAFVAGALATSSCLFGLHAIKVFSVHRVDQINFSTQEAQNLGIAILLNIEPHGVQVRQWMSMLVVLPIIRMPVE